MSEKLLKILGYLVSTLFVSTIIIVLFSLLALVSGTILNLLAISISDNSVLYQLTSIDFLSLLKLAIVLIPIILFSLFIFWIILIFMREFKVLTIKRFNAIVIFSQKFAIAIYPTLILAGALNEASFSLLTNLISFFAIFTFVFKPDFIKYSD